MPTVKQIAGEAISRAEKWRETNPGPGDSPVSEWSNEALLYHLANEVVSMRDMARMLPREGAFWIMFGPVLAR